MRTDLQLICSTLGIEKSDKISIDNIESSDHYNLYRIDLTNLYKGFNPHWYFVILRSLERIGDIQFELQKIVREQLDKKISPIVLINDNDKTIINDLVLFDNASIFTIDHRQMPSEIPKGSRNIPLIRAIKNRIGVRGSFSNFINPYTPGTPIKDSWRFHGRKSELLKLMDSDESFFILGGRRSGKTSLINEFALRMKFLGHEVYNVPTQAKSTAQKYAESVAFIINPQDYIKLTSNKHYKRFDFFEVILSRLKPNGNKLPIIILDEIGTLLNNLDRDSWNILGALREQSQRKKFRVVITGFQEILMKQYYEYNGPFVNFGRNLKLEALAEKEIYDFLVEPLSYWTNFQEKNEFVTLIQLKVGTHPLPLQYIGDFIFKEIFRQGNARSPLEILKSIIDGDNLKLFKESINELFFDIDFENNLPIEKFLFLYLTKEARAHNKDDVTKRTFDVFELKESLQNVGFKMTLDDVSRLIIRLELRGLVKISETKHTEFNIALPIVSYYLEKFHPVEKYFETYHQEVLDGIDNFIQSFHVGN